MVIKVQLVFQVLFKDLKALKVQRVGRDQPGRLARFKGLKVLKVKQVHRDLLDLLVQQALFRVETS
jgi:hypothetical protein